MTNIGYLIIFLLFFITQIVFVPFIEISGVRPDVLLVFLVFWGMNREHIVGTVAGFSIGLIQDFFTVGILGTYALVKTLAGFLVRPFSLREKELSLFGLASRFFGLAFLHDLILNWIYIWGTETSIWFVTVRFVLPGALYSTVVALISYALLPRSFFQKNA